MIFRCINTFTRIKEPAAAVTVTDSSLKEAEGSDEPTTDSRSVSVYHTLFFFQHLKDCLWEIRKEGRKVSYLIKQKKFNTFFVLGSRLKMAEKYMLVITGSGLLGSQ